MFGFNWKVKVDPKQDCGAYCWDTKVILLGNKSKEADKILIHELLEAVLTHNHCRFYGNENAMEFRFFFDHTKLAEVGEQFAVILKENNLLNS